MMGNSLEQDVLEISRSEMQRCKMLLIGREGSGKSTVRTALLSHFADREFNKNHILKVPSTWLHYTAYGGMLLHHLRTAEWVIFVCNLHQYCHYYYLMETNTLHSSIDTFRDKIANEYAGKMIVLLNFTDVFRKCLMDIPLHCHFSDYYGRYYNEIKDVDEFRICLKLMELMLPYKAVTINSDIVGLVAKFLNLRELWLDLVHKDGVSFIKNKFIAIDKNIKLFDIAAIDNSQTKQIIEYITHGFQT